MFPGYYGAASVIDGDTSTLCVSNDAASAEQYVSMRVTSPSVSASGSLYIGWVSVTNRADGAQYEGWLSPHDVYVGGSFGNKTFHCGSWQASTSGMGPFRTWCGYGVTDAAAEPFYVTLVLPAGHGTRYLTVAELNAYEIDVWQRQE